MKKFRSIALLVLAISMLLLSLASCEMFGGKPEDNHIHSFSEATCTSPGICECGATDGGALGHDLVHDDIYILPTCTEEGRHGGMHCERCSFTVAPSILPAKGHSYKTDLTSPTCTEKGYTTYTCDCGDSYVSDYTNETGHAYASIVTPPTCTAGGYTTYTCDCGYSLNADPTAAVGHSYESGVCTVCGEEDPNAEDPKKVHYDFMPLITEQMPAIYINTPDNSNTWATKYNRSDKLNGKIEYVKATVSTGNCEDDYILSNLEANVKVRGNYTLDYAKKPIRIKFEKKQNMLGLHDGEKYKNWVLLADWKDLSMTNNTVAFYLGNTILASDGYYCTDFRNVEVYLNGEYWGVYLLVEQQEAKDGRSSVPEVEDDYTGNDIGYFFEFDGYWNLEGPDGDPTFTMNHQGLATGNNGYTVKSDINADSQLDFLSSYMNNAFYIAYQANFKGKYYKFNEDFTAVVEAPEITSAKEAVGNVIDLQSLVDMYILNELAKDLDFDWSSIYLSVNMTSEGNKKITFEAPWDFDSCFGIIERENCSATNDMYAKNDENPWIRLVRDQDWFWTMVYEKWAEMKEYNLFENLISFIELQSETYKNYYIKNYQKWSSRVSGGNSECVGILNSYKDINTAQGYAVDYLIDWLTKRFTYLDSVFTVVPEEPLPENGTMYRYEAEYAELGGFTSSTPVRTDRDYASNNAYVGDVRGGATITFTVNSDEATTARLYLGISKLGSGADVNSWFTVSVNGTTLDIPSRQVPAISGGEEDYHTFLSIDLTNISLIEGDNVIVVTAVTSTTNVDYIEIYSPSNLK